MPADSSHAESVAAWLDRAARRGSPAHLARRFEAALGAIWSRTETILGEVTLTAVADRVLHNSIERFPQLAVLKIEPPQGFVCAGLCAEAAGLPARELEEGVRFVLVELLTVLGNLTAEILTPQLHAVLDDALAEDTRS